MTPLTLTRRPSRSRLAVRRVSPAARGGAPASSGARLGGPALLFAFSLAAVGAGAGRALTTTYLPVLLERINDAPSLIGAVMTVNALAGFAVPIAVGVWSDRRGRRLPFIAGGAVLTGGGLVAVGLGNGTSYVALGLSAALVYAGLNALTTGHRAIVAEDVDDAGRPAATSAQEIAGLVGAVVAVAIGGALIEPAPAAAFALATVVLTITVVPTMIVSRRLGLGEREPNGDAERAPSGAGRGATEQESAAGRPEARPGRGLGRVRLGEALRHAGAREVLLAQVLWVFAYAALPSFFVLYAEKSLGLGVGVAGALPLGFGMLTAVGMVVAGRAKPERVRPLLLAGAALLGGGLLAAAPAGSLAAAAPGFAAAALGAGLVTALGFPYFARFVPEGEAGRYSGLFFAGRAVAAAAALPLAGLAVELSGSYTAVLWLGAAALAALAPLAAAERAGLAALPAAGEAGAVRAVAPPAALGARPASVAAVIPVFASERAVEVARATLKHVDELVLVDDGAPRAIAASLDALRGDDRVRVLRLGENGGKGTAVAAGAELLLAESRPPEAIVVLDSDGQHDPERIPAFLDAARQADVVIGNRRDRKAMPLVRRIGNRLATLTLLGSSRAWIPDTQNGMRLFTRSLLKDFPIPTGGYDAESRHLRALLRSGQSVASVEIPTIYDGEPSHFRPIRDTVRVGRALAGGAAADRGTAADALVVLRAWMPRLGAVVLAAIALGLAMPLFQPLDNTLFLALNGLGDGPEWLYQALDPHARNYVLLTATTIVVAAIVLRRPRYVLGAALGVVLAAYVAGAAIELVKLFVERPRPEEVLGGQVLLAEGRSWAHLASFPSGHLIVTTAMAAAASVALPVLRKPLIAYVVLIGLTRILFGAHFPLDVLAGAVLGYEIGLFAASLMASARLLPVPVPELGPAPLRLRPAAARSPRPR
jgi:membrane-associated phospholipid phosphatase/MFS family permease